MPVIVNPNTCDGCGNSTQPPCVRMCPGDLIVKDMKTNKAYLKYPEDCWDCLPCVKACPEEAIVFKLSYQFGSPEASLVPHVHARKNQIEWELTDIQGNKESFTIRTKILPVELDEKVEGVSQPDFSI
jgi:adenylylsulfate reductase, subunit B